MTEMQQAHHELDRLQGIITRHEGFMFTLRGWLLTVIGALVAAYYTDNVALDAVWLRLGLPAIAALFFVVETRHANLVEAIVERAAEVEALIAGARRSLKEAGWYDGPRVSQAAEGGARRWFPRRGMTFVLNRPFYLVVALIILVVSVSLPPKTSRAGAADTVSAGLAV